MSTNQIQDVREFMVACDQTVDQFNVRQTALYTGLELEEMGEKVAAILGERSEQALYLKCLAAAFKQGAYDEDVAKADRAEMLDADLDLKWVATGGALSVGADVPRAWDKVEEKNDSKVDPATGKARRDENGKIMKPEGFVPPDLADCLHPLDPTAEATA